MYAIFCMYAIILKYLMYCIVLFCKTTTIATTKKATPNMVQNIFTWPLLLMFSGRKIVKIKSGENC